MNLFITRLLVFTSLIGTLVFPTYLTMKTHIAEFIWLYAPIVGFWITFIFNQNEPPTTS